MTPVFALFAMTPFATAGSADVATLASPPEPPIPAAIAKPLAEDLPGFSYTFVELNYRYWDTSGDTLNGAEFKASLGLPLFFFLQGSYARLSGDIDVDVYRLGLGAHFSLLDRVDLYGILSYARDEADGSGFDDSEDGTSAEAGVRFMLTPKLEVNGKAEWLNLDQDDANFGAGARFYLTDRISLGAEVESLDSDFAGRLGARFQF